MFDLSEKELVDTLTLVARLKAKLARQLFSEGFNIGINIGQQAGQTVMHAHVHVIPRYKGDVVDPTGGVRNVIPGKGNYLNVMTPENGREMIGSIAGDIIGSVHEGTTRKSKEFPLFTAHSTFTDDSVLTVAVADAVQHDRDYGAALRRWGRLYPNAGYGGWFLRWLFSEDPQPYNSFGNGSAMRVSAIGWAFDDFEEVILEAGRSAEVTHNHPEGIKGAQAVAAAVFLARTGQSKDEIRAMLLERFGYDCSERLDDLRRRVGFDVTCQGTVPSAMIAFFESEDFEDAVRNAVSLGGDADTLACIAGAVAEAYYGGVPDEIRQEVFARLDGQLINAVRAFAGR